MRLCLTIAMHQLQEPHIIEQSNRKVSLAKVVKGELSNPATLLCLRIAGEMGTEHPANWLSSELTKQNHFTVKKLIHFWCELLCKALLLIHSMNCFDTETAAVVNHTKKYIRKTHWNWYVLLKAAASNNTKKKSAHGNWCQQCSLQ